MILCICAQVTEQEYKDFLKNPSQYYDNDDFMIRIDMIGRGCGTCEDRMHEISRQSALHQLTNIWEDDYK